MTRALRMQTICNSLSTNSLGFLFAVQIPREGDEKCECRSGHRKYLRDLLGHDAV